MKRWAAVLVMSAVWHQGALALGLGEIEVGSRLNQKFDARITLVAVRDGDLENIRVQLADDEAFEAAGLPRLHLLTALRFETVDSGDGAYVQVRSKGLVREPALNFIVEVIWAKGRILREYTVLLGK